MKEASTNARCIIEAPVNDPWMKAFGPFRLDPTNQCLWREEARISLTPKVFSVLSYLVDHPRRLVTQDELLEAIWPETYVQPEVLRTYILDLRKALGDRPKDPLYIETLPKRGYQFIASIVDQAGPSSPDDPAAPVGREHELAELDGYLRKALDGQRQVVFVTGEAGIGKSTLLDAFERRLGRREKLRVARGQCVEGFGGKEAYYPFLDAFGQLVRSPGLFRGQLRRRGRDCRRLKRRMLLQGFQNSFELSLGPHSGVV